MSRIIDQEKGPSLFDLIEKAEGGEKDEVIENGYLELPSEVNASDFLSKLVENKDEIKMQNWGEWGVSDVDVDNYGKEKWYFDADNKIEKGKFQFIPWNYGRN
jgi:hypothetical protein